MTMKLVSTVTVGAGGTSSIAFTGIPQTGTDLVLIISGRSTDGSATPFLTFNADFGSNYVYRYLLGTGATTSTVLATTDTALPILKAVNPSTYTADTFSAATINILNYTSNAAKLVSGNAVGENNATSNGLAITAGKWTGTGAITALSFSAVAWAAGSTISLYTLTKGSGGATIA